MNKKLVTFDVDGCLADFESDFCETFGYDNREKASLEKRYPKYSKEIQEFVKCPHTYIDLKPIQLGLDICNWLNDNGFDIAIVSSRPHGTLKITIDWLNKHGVKFVSISVTPAVTKLCRVSGISPLLHVDDMWSVARELDKKYIDCILVEQPWNYHRLIEFPRVNTVNGFVHALKIVYDWRTR